MVIKTPFLRKNWRSIFSALAFGIDLVSIMVCGMTAWYLLSHYYNGPVLSLQDTIYFVSYYWLVLSFYTLVLGVYRQSFFTNSSFHLMLAAKSYIYSTLTIMAAYYFIPQIYIPRSTTVIFLLLLPIHFLIGRLVLRLLNRVFKSMGLGIYKTLIVTNGKRLDEIIQQFQWFPEFGYDIRGAIHSSNGFSDLDEGNNAPLRIFATKDLRKVIKEEQIDRIFIPSTSFVLKGFHDIIELCKEFQVKIKVVSPEANDLLRMARVYDIAGITLYAPPRNILDRVKSTVHRLIDFIGASILLLLLSPIFIFTILAIFLESGGPIFYKQLRSSTKGSKQFYFYKFRSMVPTADTIRADLSLKNETTGALFKIKNDPRITRVGRIIRKYSIDELPQLFNVLKGEMSLVGPRPLPLSDFEAANESDEFWEAIIDRSKVNPGMTGLWQISGRSDIPFSHMVLLDLYYVENQSLLFDLEILFETVPAVLFGRGAY